MSNPRYKITATKSAARDIAEIRQYTISNYGSDAAQTYDSLIRQAFKDIRNDPLRPGSMERPEIGKNVRSYHIALSTKRAASDIKNPRHLVLYFLRSEDEIAVSRVLHDSRDLARHVPDHHADRARDFKEKRRKPEKDRDDRSR